MHRTVFFSHFSWFRPLALRGLAAARPIKRRFIRMTPPAFLYSMQCADHSALYSISRHVGLLRMLVPSLVNRSCVRSFVLLLVCVTSCVAVPSQSGRSITSLRMFKLTTMYGEWTTLSPPILFLLVPNFFRLAKTIFTVM